MKLNRRGSVDPYLCIAVVLLVVVAEPFAQEPARTSGWVAIPIVEYQQLRAKAYPVEPIPEPAVVQAVLTRISYDLQVAGDLAVGRANLFVDVIKDGWVRIPIPPTLLVREAKLDGKPVSLVKDDPSSTGKSAVFYHKGRAELQFEVVLPVTTAATNESITLPPVLAGITQASIKLPRQGVDVKLAGGFLAERTASAIESRWVAYGRGIAPLVFSWWKKADNHRNSQPLKMRGSLTEFVGLGEDSTPIQAEVGFEVLQGAAHEIKLQLPDKVTINQVSGAMIADWELKSGELVVTFLEPVENSARFVLTGETRTPREGRIDVPLLHILNAERVTGGVAVEVLGAGEIKDRKSAGLENADATDLGELVANRQSPSLLAFKFRSGDAKAVRSLAVDVVRYTQEAVLMANIEEARYRILRSADGKSLVQARYAIRNNQRNFLKISLPPNAVVWSATLSSKPIRPGQSPDGGLLLPLEKSRAGEDAPAFAAEIFYFTRDAQWDRRGKCRLALPVLDLPISTTGLEYYHPPFYKVTLDPGSFRTQTFQAPVSAVFYPKSANSSSASADSGKVQQLPLASNDVMDLINIMGGVVKMENPIYQESTQALVDRYRNQSQDGKRAGILPLRMDFPEFGPALYLVSELTAENQLPAIDLNYAADKKGGIR
jgi:hypothetical protein